MSGYAIISLGGKQYRVQEGERLLVDRLKADEGKTFEPRVLLVGGDGDADLAPTATVTARVVGHELGEKIRIGKYKKRTGYKRHNGYRSRLTQIEIESIGAAARRPRAAKPKAEKARRPRPAAAEGREARAPRIAEGLRGYDGRADHRGRAGWSRPNVEAALADEQPARRARARSRRSSRTALKEEKS